MADSAGPATPPPGLGHRCHIRTGTGLILATSAPGLGHPCHIRTGTGPTPATSALRLGPPLLHPHRDWADPCHIRTGTGPTPPTSAPGLGHPCHIRTGTGLILATSAPGLGASLPHPHRAWAHPCHICTETGPTPATSAPIPPPFGLCSNGRACAGSTRACARTWTATSPAPCGSPRSTWRLSRRGACDNRAAPGCDAARGYDAGWDTMPVGIRCRGGNVAVWLHGRRVDNPEDVRAARASVGDR